MAIIKTPILNGSGKIVDANLPDRLLDPQLTATYVPKWKATTVYVAGDKVLNPSGDVVAAKVNFTSGASYSAADWKGSSTNASTDTGKGLGLVGGVVRNYADGLGHRLIDDGFHPPFGLTGADSLTDPGLIEITYPNVGARTGTLIVTPDETLAKAGFIAGASVDPDKARVQLAQWRMHSDYVYYTGSAWAAWHDAVDTRGPRSPFTIGTWTAGHLTLNHETERVRDEAFSVIVQRVGGPGENYEPVLSTSSDQSDRTKVVIDFYTPSLVGSKTHDWASIGDSSSANTTVTVTGAQLGDFAQVSMNIAIPAGMTLTGLVTAVDTVTVTLVNRSGATQDPASGTLTAKTTRSNGGDYRITTADTKCKFRIIAGMYRTFVLPADVSETTYPGANIWVFGGMQKDA